METNLFGIRHQPSREGQDKIETGSRAPPSVQPRPTSKSPDVLRITSDLQGPEEPPMVAVTSDLPQFRDDSHGPRSTNGKNELPAPAQRAFGPSRPPDPASTPGRSRIEVVLNVSPYKPPIPGQTIWDDAHMDDEDELALTSDLTPGRRKRLHESTLTASSSLRHATPATPTAPVTGKRPRGRPKGWRPGMPSLKTGLLTASASKYLDKDGKRIPPPPASSAAAPRSTGLKRRGRPPRAPSPSPRGVWEKMTPPKYVPFTCEWTGCKAELQNIETLRRHVLKVHARADPLVCRWASCGRRDGENVLVFEQDYEFHDHMDQRHLVPFVWFVGDGARNKKCVVKSEESDPAEIPTYLLGPDGTQVTPSVREQELEDFVTWRENRRRLKEILIQRDANAPSEEEEDDEEQARLEAAIAASLAA